jgi:asparagine synthase (glutamine-hydrolysing)
MYAFAVWDAQERRLTLARDAFGIKPLYYTLASGRLTFASELHALITARALAGDIDPAALGAALAYLAVPAPGTIYRDAHTLRPGEYATFDTRGLTVRAHTTFADLAVSDEKPAATRAEFQDTLRARLDDSVRAHALADVPVGAFLSGGLDSSALVALWRRQQSGPLKTFSLGFAETDYSEAAAAEATAHHLGTTHHTEILAGETVAHDIERFIAVLDQPTGDALNTYYISRAARAGGVKVALSGLGGDELFGGYPWFRTTPRLARLLPLWRLVPAPLRALMLARARHGDARTQKLADFLTHARTFDELASLQRRTFAETARQKLLREPGGFFAHPELAHLPSELGDAPPLRRISAWELRTYTADVLLRDSDITSMAHSLELRVPWVDGPLLAWLWRQRPEWVYAAPPVKAALLAAVRAELPPELATRPKRGFTLPLARWMRGPLRPWLESVFAPASVARSGWFATEAVRATWETFLRRDDPREWSRVWSLAIAIAFVNRPRPK